MDESSAPPSQKSELEISSNHYEAPSDSPEEQKNQVQVNNIMLEDEKEEEVKKQSSILDQERSFLGSRISDRNDQIEQELA